MAADSPRQVRVAALGATLAACLSAPSVARAEAPPAKGDVAPSADQGASVDACVSLRAAADQEMYRRHHPGPRAPGQPWADGKALGVGLTEAFTVVADIGLGVVSAVAPNVGVRVGDGRSDLVLSWALSVPFGPDVRCRLYGKSVYRGMSRHRALLEPGLLIGPQVGGFVRPGYRLLIGTDASGYGVGLGSTFEWLPDRFWRPSVSPEVFLHLGDCCLAGYVTLALRYDRFFAGRERDMWSLSVGLTAF